MGDRIHSGGGGGGAGSDDGSCSRSTFTITFALFRGAPAFTFLDSATSPGSPYAERRVRLDRGRRPARTKSAGRGTRSTGSGPSALRAPNVATQPMGHSTHPIASTSSLTCAAVMAAAEGADGWCSVERRGGRRSTWPTRHSMILPFLPWWSLMKPCMSRIWLS